MAERVSEAMAAGSPWLLPLALLGGLLTSLNPCTYPLLALVAGYVWQHGERRAGRSALIAGAFVLGLALTYALLGAVGGLVGPILGLSRELWLWLLGVVCIVAGLFMAEVLTVNLPSASLLVRFWPRLRGLPGALLLGMLLGLAATPCATPPLMVVVSVAAAHRVALFGALLMFAYAVGHALPAVLVGLLAGSLAGFDRLAPYGRGLQVAGGWLVIAVGFYLIIVA